MKPVPISISQEYRDLLPEISTWVNSKPRCDFAIFKKDDVIHPEMKFDTEFSLCPETPYAFIRNPPTVFYDRIVRLVPPDVLAEHSLVLKSVLLFCNKKSLDWHSDGHIRKMAINIGVTDVIGETHSVYSALLPDQSVSSFSYEYQKAYLIDINSQHKLDTDFFVDKIRVSISLTVEPAQSNGQR